MGLCGLCGARVKMSTTSDFIAQDYGSVRGDGSGGNNAQNFAAARATADASYTGGLYGKVKVAYNDYVYLARSVAEFDTSSILAHSIITKVDLRLNISTNGLNAGEYIDIMKPSSMSASWLDDVDTYKDNIFDGILGGTFVGGLSQTSGSSGYEYWYDLSNSLIITGGLTFVGLITRTDRNNNVPTSTRDEQIVYTATGYKGARLTITYDDPPPGDLMFWFT